MKSIKEIPFNKLYVGMKVKYHDPEVKPSNGEIEYLAKTTRNNQKLIVIRWDDDKVSTCYHNNMNRHIYYSEV